MFVLRIITIVLTFTFSTALYAQTSTGKVYLDTCETAEAKMAVVGNFLNQDNVAASHVILIVGSPVGVNQKYDRRRIRDVKKYLSKYHGIPEKRIIWGIGENSSKLSYLRFYLSDESILEINTSSRGRLCDAFGEIFSAVKKRK